MVWSFCFCVSCMWMALTFCLIIVINVKNILEAEINEMEPVQPLVSQMEQIQMGLTVHLTCMKKWDKK